MSKVAPVAVLLSSLLVCRHAAAQDFLLQGPGVIVKTTHGPVEGRKDTGVVVFRGIPYAAAPVGFLRFRPPVAPKSWEQVRRAWVRTAACPQILNKIDVSEDGEAVMDEDCLTVNVWTPGPDASRRPVMVFIHGGGFVEGSAADTCYDGATLATRGDVVVVSLQYRLGIFGFLELGDVGGVDYAQSGNLGILDQIAALRWVQNNAAAFGGDANNVTVFGESAGGASIIGLLATPKARSLFHKAIIQSGDPAQFQSRDRALKVTREVQDAAHARSVADLQRLSMPELLRIQARVFENDITELATFTLVGDGIVFSETPIEAIEHAPGAAVPLLIGTNSEEMRYSVAMEGSPIDRQPQGALRGYLKKLFGPPGESLIEVYKKYSQTSDEAITTLLGDAIFRIPALRLAEVNAPRKPTYVYLFTYRSPAKGPTGLEYGAMHGLEVAPVFHDDYPIAYSYTGPKGTWSVLSEQMMAAWTSFARFGNPDTTLLPPWPRYDANQRATMVLGAHSDVMLDPYRREREAWNDVPTRALQNVDVMALWEPLPGG
jgi:para-nitrobenzyl esterase